MDGEEEGRLQHISPKAIWEGDRIVLDPFLVLAGEWPSFDRLEKNPGSGTDSLRHDIFMVHPGLRSGPLEERLYREKGDEHRDLYFRLEGEGGKE